MSIIPLSFTHPDFEGPQKAYLIRGKDLTEEQLNKLAEKIKDKFKEKDLNFVKEKILENELPLRTSLTSGVGTTKLHYFMPDDFFDEKEYDDDFLEDEPEYEDDWSCEDYMRGQK